jgi:hypothetical protein
MSRDAYMEREELTIADWTGLWDRRTTSEPVRCFIYRFVGEYGDLPPGSVRPADPIADIFARDWEYDLFDDFREEFHVDLEPALRPSPLGDIRTLGELGEWLERHLRQDDPSEEQ